MLKGSLCSTSERPIAAGQPRCSALSALRRCVACAQGLPTPPTPATPHVTPHMAMAGVPAPAPARPSPCVLVTTPVFEPSEGPGRLSHADSTRETDWEVWRESARRSSFRNSPPGKSPRASSATYRSSTVDNPVSSLREPLDADRAVKSIACYCYSIGRIGGLCLPSIHMRPAVLGVPVACRSHAHGGSSRDSRSVVSRPSGSSPPVT
jgi:hypothetical protein